MPLKDYIFDQETFTVTDDMQSCFNNNGYLLLRGLLSSSELEKVKNVVENNAVIDKFAYGNKDDKNRVSRLCLWNHPGNDVTGMVARCSKVAGTCEKILSGSHLCGRVDHGVVGRQIGADADRVAEISKVCEHLYIELNPGDALYFHGNVIHTSSANNSDTRRWAFLCAYNKASNNPVKEHLHPHYTPLTQVADTAIMECSVPWDSTGKDLVTKDRRERFVMAS